MRYSVASESVRSVAGTTPRTADAHPLRDRTDPRRRSIPTTVSAPVGRVHAVDVRTGETACGTPVTDLHLFPRIDWARATHLQRCPECRQVATTP